MKDHLHHALDLAARGRGDCAPNPAVGAVVVSNGAVVGEGWHRGPGGPHAEVHALSAAREQARGATVVVTLEPCGHWGRTPPCTQALIEAGVAKVVFGLADPNPKVSRAAGLDSLREAGIEVVQCADPAVDQFYQDYVHWTRTGLPRWIAKLAVSRDGMVAGEGGRPVRISGAEADALTHRERRIADALLTTGRTVAVDDPQLNAREGETPVARSVWVVGSQGVGEGARLRSTAREWRHWTGRDLAVLKAEMGRAGLHRVWIEAGPTFFKAAYAAGVLDETWIYECERTLGRGVPASLEWMKDRGQRRPLGADAWWRWEKPCSQG